MLRDLDNRRDNPDGADQGFIGGYFPDLLDQPMFIHPLMEPNLMVHRLPLGYQMDASYYYLRLTWSVPCQPNNVITFPGASWLKPWYWWSWPVLPLGIQWHEQRRETIGYDSEMPFVLIQTIIYLCIIAVTHLARPTTKLCYRGTKFPFQTSMTGNGPFRVRFHILLLDIQDLGQFAVIFFIKFLNLIRHNLEIFF